MNPRHLSIAVGIAVLMGALGLALGRYGAYLVDAVAIAAIGALSLNLLIGYCGQISFAQGALLGVGAYTAGNLSNAGLDGAAAILGGGILGAAISALIGLPAMRLRGLYFAIATLAAQAILEYLFKILDPLTHGVSGLVIKPTQILGFPMSSELSLMVPALVILVIVWLTVSRLMRIDLGRAFLVVRESEIVAKGMGVDIAHTKMWAFLISGFIAGMGGALAGFANRLASPEAFTLDLSADYIAMIIIGGLATWPSPLIGAAFVVLLPELIQRAGEAAGISDILSAARARLRAADHPVPDFRAARTDRTAGAAQAAPRGRKAAPNRASHGRWRSTNRGGIQMKRTSTAALLALALAAATSPARADVNVCIWGTITGPDALVNGMSYGVRDYLEFLNQTQGGIAGSKVNALLLDGRYKLEEELKIYRRCVGEENAVVVDGWSTGSVKALRDQITSDAVPFMTQSFASEVLDPKKYPYIFMAGPTYEQQMAIAFRDLVAKGGKKVVIMAPDNEYGRGPVNVVRQSGIIEKLGLTLVDTVEFRYDAQDLTAQMLRVKSRDPDLVYIQASTPQAIAILRDAAKVGLPAKLFVGNLYTISPTIPEQLGEAAEGFRAIQAYAFYGADIPAVKQIDEFAAKNQIEKKDIYYMKGWMEGIAISAAIENAIKKNGGQPPADIKQFRQEVRDQMEALSNLNDGGITPPLNFANHQGSTDARIAEIKGGKYVPTGEWINAGT